jgi:hypothetical protein
LVRKLDHQHCTGLHCIIRNGYSRLEVNRRKSPLVLRLQRSVSTVGCPLAATLILPRGIGSRHWGGEPPRSFHALLSKAPQSTGSHDTIAITLATGHKRVCRWLGSLRLRTWRTAHLRQTTKIRANLTLPEGVQNTTTLYCPSQPA